MRENVAIQMREQVFNGQEIIAVINIWTETRLPCHYLPIHDDALAWLIRDIICWPCCYKGAVDHVVKRRKLGGKYSYDIAGVVDHLLEQYETDAVIAKDVQNIHNSYQGSLMRYNFSETLLDLTLPFGGVHNK